MISFDNLPNEIKFLIVKTDNPKQLSKLREINSNFKNLCESNLLWKDLVIKKFTHVDDKGQQEIPEMINNSWFKTYIFLSKNSRSYVLSEIYKESKDSDYKIIGVYKSFRLACNSLLNYIIDEGLFIDDPFKDFFLEFYPQFRVNFNIYHSSRYKLLDNDQKFKQKVRPALSHFLKKRQSGSLSEKQLEYKLDYSYSYRINITNISYN